MNFTLTRQRYSLYGVFGKLVSDDGSSIFATLEHAYPVLGPSAGKEWIAKLAPGKYTCHKRKSPHFGYTVFVIENAPPFQGAAVNYIEIHIGNYNNDSEGCILIGVKAGTGMIEDSIPAFHHFMELQKDVDTFELTVV